MTRRDKYSRRSTEQDSRAQQEHRVFPHDNRALSPHGGANGEHLLGRLALDSGGDWSWKPQRKDTGTAFKGVPPGAAEAYGTRIKV